MKFIGLLLRHDELPTQIIGKSGRVRTVYYFILFNDNLLFYFKDF